MRNDQRDEQQTHPYATSDEPAEHGIPAPRTSDDAWAPPADEDRAAEDRADEDRADETQTPEDRTGERWTADEDRAAEDRADETQTPEDRTGEGWTADDRAAEDRVEEDRAAEDEQALAAPVDEETDGETAADRPLDGERPDEPMVSEAQVTETDETEADETPEPAVGVASVEPAAVGVAPVVPDDEADRADEQAADEQATDEQAAELKPGDVDALPDTTVWDDDAIERVRTRWHEVQLQFIDDPRAAAEQAESLVSEAVDNLTTALAATKQELGGWRSADSGDTEHFRMAVRNYRDFLDRILGR